MQSVNPSSGPTAWAAGPHDQARALPPQPAEADPAAAASDSGQLPIKVPPANITVVRTARELQEATLFGAQDIEIRAHLDLRPLFLAANPKIKGVETQINRKRLALLYASPPLRSIRGNCSDPGAVAALGLPPDTFPDLLPLKPRQCLLVVADTWLMLNSGSVWVDNVYLKLSRSLLRPNFAFITAGALNGEVRWPNIKRSDIYVTATTFHGEHRGSAKAIIADHAGTLIYADGCIFTDWAGTLSPITLKFRSVATIRNSGFRNMHLHVEIVDVSYKGIINFQNVLLANVTLEHGLVARTSLENYQPAMGLNIFLSHYIDTYEDYDMEWATVKWRNSGGFGEEFKVINDTISNCFYLQRAPDFVMPGCPNRTAEARNRTIDRGFPIIGQQRTGVPLGRSSISGDEVDYGAMYAEYLGADAPFHYAAPSADAPSDYNYAILSPDAPFHHEITSEYTFRSGGLSDVTDYEVLNSPELSFEVIYQDEFIWLDETRMALPTFVPPSGPWPSFTRPPRPETERRSLLPEVKAAMLTLGPLSEQSPPLLVAHNSAVASSTTSDDGDSNCEACIGVVPVLLIIITELLVAAALLWLWVEKGHVLTRRYGCGWIARRGRFWCGAGRRRRGQNAPSCSGTARDGPRSSKAADAFCSIDYCAAGIAIGRVEAGQSIATQCPQSERANCTHGSELGGTLTDVSRGADVTPVSALNPAYEYALPPHLAQATQCRRFHDEICEADSGGTVVRSPYTVDVQAGDAVALDENSGRDKAVLAGASVSPGHQTPSAIAPAAAVDVTQHAMDTTSSAQAATRLQQQLDSFSFSDLLLGKFEVLGPRQRRRGGQAVVQFVHRSGDRCEFAVKFFLDRASFLTEAALYAAAFPSVRSTVSTEIAAQGSGLILGPADEQATPMAEVVSKFLPQVEAVCDGGAAGLVDPWGRPLPPCIVMEKGESLQDLCDRAEPDLFSVFSVLSNVSRRLADMHAGGYVHRDLKPANVMWLPRQNRWTVIDFGCVARVGQEVPLSFTLAYAPPEIAVAWRVKCRKIVARPSLDAWSLGVMAFELLTGAPAFNLVGRGRSAVLAMLEGMEALPWEGKLSAEVQRKFGVFSRPVMQLLERDPHRRSSLEAFHASCANIFARAAPMDPTQSTAETSSPRSWRRLQR